jgi:hypothetical protein
MKKAIVLLAVLGLVAAANADVRFYFTASTDAAYGLTNVGNALKPGLEGSVDTDDSNGDPAYGVTAYPTFNAANIPTVDYTKNEFVYVWVQFYSTGTAPTFPQTAASTYVPNNGKLFSATLTATGDPAKVAWYRVDNQVGDGTLRWQGAATAPDFPEFTDPTEIALTAVTSYGIQNKTAANPYQLWSGNAGGRVALLGAIKPSKAGDFTINVPAETGTGLPLLAYNAVIGGAATSYAVLPVFGSYHVIPEPASMLLLGLAGLLIRRR